MVEVSESRFYEKARENAKWWMDIGWPNPEPDVPQCFSKNSLINIVSIATGWKSSKSEPWLEKNKILASHGDYCFFSELLNGHAHHIVRKLLRQCDGDDEAYLTVLPLAYYYDGYYYEFPIFRFSRFKNSTDYYITIEGTIYYCSIEKLAETIKFPGQIIAYPKGGRLIPRSETDPNIDMCFYKPEVGFFSGMGNMVLQMEYNKRLGKDVLSRPWADLVLKKCINKYSDSEYQAIAVENITRYLHRGGRNKGDEPQFIEGAELYNTIGFSMGIMPDMPSEENLDAAMQGNYCYYSGDVLKLIRHIAKKIEENCRGDKKNYITVIPIEVFCDHKLIEMPLFRFNRIKNKDDKFVDCTGRVYQNFKDWRFNNKLPPGIQLYPGVDGHLIEKCSTGYAACFQDETPSMRSGAKILRGADMIIGLAGLGATVATLFTGGLALPLIAVGSAAYGTIRSFGTVIDRGQHDESLNPITDEEARMLWLGIAANLLSFGSMGATMGLTILAAKGNTFTATFCTIVNIANGSAATVNTAAILNSTIHMIANWENMGPEDWAMQLMSIAFWAKGTYNFKTASTMITETRALMLDGLTNQLQGQHSEDFKDFRAGFNNDAFLIKFLQAHASAGRSPEVMASYLSQLKSVASDLKVPYHVGADGTVAINHSQVSLDLLLQLNPDQREGLTYMLGKFNQDQSTKFQDIVAHHGHDYHTIFGNIAKIKAHYPNMNIDQVMEGYFKLWDYHQANQHFSGSQTASAGGNALPIRFHTTNPGQIIIGNGHVFNLLEIRAFDNRIVKLLMTDFNAMTTEQVTSFNLIRDKISNDELLPWIDKNNELIQNLTPRLAKLQSSSNLFHKLQVKLMENGELLLNKLIQLPFDQVENIVVDNNNFIKLLNDLPKDLSSKKLASDIQKRLDYFRRAFKLKFEFHRQEAFDWFIEATKPYIDKNSDFGKITHRSQLTYTQHQDRLVTLHSNASKVEFKTVIAQIVQFSCLMKPEGVIEFASYFDFACTYYQFKCGEAEFAVAQYKNTNPKMKIQQIKQHFNLTGKNLMDCYRENAKLEAFGNSEMDIIEKFKLFQSVVETYMNIADSMFGILKLPDNIHQMDEMGIIGFIRHPDNIVKFGSKLSAACHVYKKNLNEPSQYLRLANELIKDVNCTRKVIISGKKFDITFEKSERGKAVVMKFESRNIILVSFTPNLNNQ